MKPNFPTVFEFDGKSATIKMLKMRKASETDAAAGAVELKIAVDGLPATCMAALIASPPGEVRDAFWRTEDLSKIDTAKGDRIDLRFVGLGALTSEASYKERHELKIRDVPPIRCDVVNAFTVTPVAGELVDVEFRVIISDPPTGWIEAASHKFMQTCLVSLRQDAELELSGGEPAPKKRGRPGKEPEALKPEPTDADTSGDLYATALAMTTADGAVSAHRLKSKLKISYERAAELITALQAALVIGLPDRSGVHELLTFEGDQKTASSDVGAVAH